MNLKPLLALALLAFAVKVASAADLSVSGQIKPVGACNLMLGNAGTIDLGTISRKDLRDEANWLNNIYRPISFSINCPMPTTVALRAIDNREGTATSEIWDAAYGLGTTFSGKKFGAYRWMPRQVKIDGSWAQQLFQKNPGDDWGMTPGLFTKNLAPNWLTTWTQEGNDLPQAFQVVAGNLEFAIHIPVSGLDLSQEINIDGSATMELVYL
ncbi:MULTISPECIES: DUF1120 domain-containing protein [Pseudomonas]|uniref:DUF1120 domain-containing protein n=1 Tax=Pseudomonas TaxID=286 RepID=UPI00236146A2|nr:MULTISPECIES: DUF1120 domain-containing protein [Pseudomonas]WJV25605.1 DUF1120 domain-containing protein [Pseudomonas chlororaphis]